MFVMSDDQRVYSDEEFAVILRKASELASQGEGAPAAADGLTLAEIKAAASQAGFDPVLVERAARQLVRSSPASPIERLMGGSLRHQLDSHLAVTLDEESAAKLLAVIRIAAGQTGSYEGHASAMGITWHDGGELEALHVSARAVEHGTRVSLVLDRRSTLMVTTLFGGFATMAVVLFGATMYSEIGPTVGMAIAVGGVGGVLATARAFWASSSRKARERMQSILDAITTR
ncbi:MAG: hypothetical protein IBJ03_02350 [Gemmatimonadaceae bacterium]|nr:hypothetical protein [Gemmatimonadaceae bacterium]